MGIRSRILGGEEHSPNWGHFVVGFIFMLLGGMVLLGFGVEKQFVKNGDDLGITVFGALVIFAGIVWIVFLARRKNDFEADEQAYLAQRAALLSRLEDQAFAGHLRK
ncbi:MAG: hypothetical protein R3B47_21065 [Bacteroidia bacterium]